MAAKSKGRARRGRPPAGEGPALDRVRLTRILLKLVRREGLQSLHMRRVATEANVSPRLLYSHVRDKAAMIDLVCEAITAQSAPRELVGTWRDRLTMIALTTSREIGRYPGVPAWVLSQTARSRFPPEAARLVAQVRQALTEAGLKGPAIQAAHLAFAAYSMGHMIIAAGSVGSRTIVKTDALFEIGLQQLLDGFEAAGRAGARGS
jgi:AcrR family transcriptional regulator